MSLFVCWHNLNQNLINSDAKKTQEGINQVCKLLVHPNGSKVYVLGTNTMSFKSQEQAQNLVRLVKPDRLVLELDESRKDLLDIDEEQIISLSKYMNINFEKKWRIYREKRNIDKVAIFKHCKIF